jgi:hypothetical protein
VSPIPKVVRFNQEGRAEESSWFVISCPVPKADPSRETCSPHLLQLAHSSKFSGCELRPDQFMRKSTVERRYLDMLVSLVFRILHLKRGNDSSRIRRTFLRHTYTITRRVTRVVNTAAVSR